MADIFISYKSERRAAARHLARIFELNGYSVWYDYGLLSGRDFSGQIESELRNAKAVVVLWCSLSRDSDWVNNEALLAKRLFKFIPVWIEDTELPLDFIRDDTIDLKNWDGSPRSHNLDRLWDEIARLTGKEQTPSMSEIRQFEATWRSYGCPAMTAFSISSAESNARQEFPKWSQKYEPSVPHQSANIDSDFSVPSTQKYMQTANVREHISSLTAVFATSASIPSMFAAYAYYTDTNLSPFGKHTNAEFLLLLFLSILCVSAFYRVVYFFRNMLRRKKYTTTSRQPNPKKLSEAHANQKVERPIGRSPIEYSLHVICSMGVTFILLTGILLFIERKTLWSAKDGILSSILPILVVCITVEFFDYLFGKFLFKNSDPINRH